jgi:hypothetical protein
MARLCDAFQVLFEKTQLAARDAIHFDLKIQRKGRQLANIALVKQLLQGPAHAARALHGLFGGPVAAVSEVEPLPLLTSIRQMPPLSYFNS